MGYIINIPEHEKVITLIGSTKFKYSFENVEKILTLNNKIVFKPTYFLHTENVKASNQTKFELDRLHKEKIAMSHAVFVVNENNYWGESTAANICYARLLGIPIYYVFDRKGKLNNNIFINS